MLNINSMISVLKIKFERLWPGVCECSDLKDLLMVFQSESRGGRCLYSLYLSNKEHLFTVLTGPPNNAIDLFPDTDCISGHRMLKQPKLEAQRCGLCAMINAPLSQSLTSTRATPPVWYTPSQIESSPLFFFLVCDVIALGRATPRLSFPAIKRYVWADFSSGSQNTFGGFWGQHGDSSAPLPAEDVMIKVCVPQA